MNAAAVEVRWRMLSQTAEYALRAVLHLAQHQVGTPTGAAEIAARLGVPERYLARVLNTLARRGILKSTRGVQGGYALQRAPQRLSLAEVVAPFDAVGEPPQCLLRDQPCGQGEPCIAHARWHDAAGSVRTFFQNTTIADLVESARRAGKQGTRRSMMLKSAEIREYVVNELIRDHPAAISVLNRYGIDTCCGGATTVAFAAERDGADLTAMLEQLEQALAGAS